MRQFYSHEVTDVHFHSFLCFQLMTTIYFESHVIRFIKRRFSLANIHKVLTVRQRQGEPHCSALVVIVLYLLVCCGRCFPLLVTSRVKWLNTDWSILLLNRAKLLDHDWSSCCRATPYIMPSRSWFSVATASCFEIVAEKDIKELKAKSENENTQNSVKAISKQI